MKTLIFALLLTGTASVAKAQTNLIKPFIDAWKVDDTSQSRRAQVFYDAQHRGKDTAFYRKVTGELERYLQQHPSKRLEARYILYQTLGALEFNYTIDSFCLIRMQKAIRLASDLNDDQLTAEIYSVYAGISAEDYLLYNLKAFELQRKVGFKHFYFVTTRLFDLSRALYLGQEYRQSIHYGLECLNTKITDFEHYDPLVYVFQLDILGACYKKLGMYDSATWYYQKLVAHVPAAIPNNLQKQDLWMGIGKGNLGHVLILQNRHDEALPLVESYLKSSIAGGDALNISMAQNFLARICLHRKQFTEALKAWREAFRWGKLARSADYTIQAAGGLAGIFKANGQTDSAWHYIELYHQLKDTAAASISQSQLSNMKARIAFDELQASLSRSQQALQKERTARNLIIAAIGLLTVIILLLYNRHRLKQKLAFEGIRQRQREAELEVKKAKEQIAGFKFHIIEKNDLIENLESQISELGQQQNQQAVALDLHQYTLLTDTEWEKFKVEFAKAYPDFLTIIRDRVPQITPAEERLATLIFLQLNTYQIASSLGISKDSVLRSKRRLKQRLQLQDPVTVEEYLYNLLSSSN